MPIPRVHKHGGTGLDHNQRNPVAVKSDGSDNGMGHDVWFKRVWKSRFMIEPSSYHQRV